jgi:hypothetical protein
VRTERSAESAVFVGEVASVKTVRRANGDLVTDTTLRPTGDGRAHEEI